MSKSNQEIWNEQIRGDKWGTWKEMGQPASLEDFAEAVREDQRKVCADAAMVCSGHNTYTTVFDDELTTAILSAGTEPELKPGMLTVSKVQEGLPCFSWHTDVTNPENYRPLTKAEIQYYMDKAPE